MHLASTLPTKSRDALRWKCSPEWTGPLLPMLYSSHTKSKRIQKHWLLGKKCNQTSSSQLNPKQLFHQNEFGRLSASWISLSYFGYPELHFDAACLLIVCIASLWCCCRISIVESPHNQVRKYAIDIRFYFILILFCFSIDWNVSNWHLCSLDVDVVHVQ